MEAKSLLNRFNPQELIRLCNEKMVCAARDLAEFTNNGINASFIVALAHKCENYEETVGGHPTIESSTNIPASKDEILEGVDMICRVGQQIWSQNPTKYNDYVINY